tara:strand:- start:37 stop:555 length:519 start_codon:yes stop_codon:yes gene_type:complete
MDKIQSTINQTLEKYQEEIHKQHPTISVQQLKNIWEFLGESKKTSEKRKRTAYQNYFVKKRGDIASQNPTLKFGEISKIISTEWNQFTEEEKNNYETKKEQEIIKESKNKMDIKNTNTTYVHLFENHTDEIDDMNRIDFEQDEGDNDVELLDVEEDDDDESGEDEIDFNDLI